MDYQITCVCHKTHRVTTGDAGSSLKCSCGLNVEVPSLSVLRQQAGEFSASPELILDSMLHNGELPQDSLCVNCHADTERIKEFNVVCEQVQEKRERVGCGYAVVMMLFFGWLIGLLWALFASKEAAHKQFGRNVRYRLPLRLCPVCDVPRSSADVKELLCHVPVYEHLLKKYPHAEVSAV